MNSDAWEEIELIYRLPHTQQNTIKQFDLLKSSQKTYTKSEGNLHHYCSFFLPYDNTANKIYLCNHIKASDWIPPGGHIEKGETPSEAAIREMHEELNITINRQQLEPWNLSVKTINRADYGCITHYDVWHLVHIKEQYFDYDKREYYDAGWFTISEGIKKITKNLDFAEITSLLQVDSQS